MRQANCVQVTASWSWAPDAPPIHEQFNAEPGACEQYQRAADGIAALEAMACLTQRQSENIRKKLFGAMMEAGLFRAAEVAATVEVTTAVHHG